MALRWHYDDNAASHADQPSKESKKRFFEKKRAKNSCPAGADNTAPLIGNVTARRATQNPFQIICVICG